MPSAIASLAPDGAGRTLAIYHPQTPDLLGGNGTLSKYLANSVTTLIAWTAMNAGGFGAIELVDGWCGIKVTTAVGSNFSGERGQWVPRSWIRYTKPQGAIPSPFGCMSMRMLLAVDQYAAQNVERNTDDLGPALMDNFNNGINGNLGKGIIFGPTSKTTARLHARAAAGGGLVVDDPAVLPAGFDSSRWHMYELRVVSATKDAEATVQGFVDGVAVTNKWGWATAGLPTPSTNPYFFLNQCACLSALAGTLHYGGGALFYAPSEAQL